MPCCSNTQRQLRRRTLPPFLKHIMSWVVHCPLYTLYLWNLVSRGVFVPLTPPGANAAWGDTASSSSPEGQLWDSPLPRHLLSCTGSSHLWNVYLSIKLKCSWPGLKLLKGKENRYGYCSHLSFASPVKQTKSANLLSGPYSEIWLCLTALCICHFGKSRY